MIVRRAVAALVLAALAVLPPGCGGGGGGEEDPVGDQAADAYPVEREVEWRGGSGNTIGATLTLPAKQRPIVAAAVIVPGFGAIDRNGVMTDDTPDRSADRLAQDLNPSRPGTPDKLLEDLSDVLAEAGIASVRYDKRGSGRSQLRPGQALSYDDLVADAKGGLDFLAQRVETARLPKAVVGHDQGGLVALRLAAGGGGGVRSVVLVSTFGRPLADVVGDDFASKGEAGRQVSEQLHAVTAELVAGGPLPKPEDISSHIRPLLVPAQEGYLRTVFGLDPVAEARAARVPVYVVRGGRDRSITAVDTERLRSALSALNEELVVAEGDHNLLIGGRVRRDAGVLSPIGDWIVSHTGG